MSLAPVLIVLVMSAAPFFEARYAIPVAIALYGFDPMQAFLLGVVGNILPVIPLLLFLEPVSDALSRHSSIFKRFFDWVFTRTRAHSERFERWGALALYLFVAMPIPVTGAWSGCAAAFIFGIRFRYALPAIAVGIVTAALITTIPTIGVLGVLGGGS
jgi:uncharacterized membrane protein